MPFPRKRSPVQFSEQEMLKLESIRKSRTEEKRRTVRAALLLDSLSGQSDMTERAGTDRIARFRNRWERREALEYPHPKVQVNAF